MSEEVVGSRAVAVHTICGCGYANKGCDYANMDLVGQSIISRPHVLKEKGWRD